MRYLERGTLLSDIWKLNLIVTFRGPFAMNIVFAALNILSSMVASKYPYFCKLYMSYGSPEKILSQWALLLLNIWPVSLSFPISVLKQRKNKWKHDSMYKLA